MLSVCVRVRVCISKFRMHARSRVLDLHCRPELVCLLALCGAGGYRTGSKDHLKVWTTGNQPLLFLPIGADGCINATMFWRSFGTLPRNHWQQHLEKSRVGTEECFAIRGSLDRMHVSDLIVALLGRWKVQGRPGFLNSL